MSATPQVLKLSAINSSRSAFGVVAFDPLFFGRYELARIPGENPHVTFCVTAKVRGPGAGPCWKFEGCELTRRDDSA